MWRLLCAALCLLGATASRRFLQANLGLADLGLDMQKVAAVADSLDAPAASPSTSTATESAPADSAEHPPFFRRDGSLAFIPAGAQPDAPGLSLSLEVPNTFNKFMEGLMYRKNMTDDEAMIFQWNEDGPRSFWMENTYIGLDIIYVNDANKVVSIVQGQSLSTDSLPSSEAARYAVEVPLGWCERHGLKVGDAMQFNIDGGKTYFVGKDRPNFGATPDEVRVAVKAGNYKVL